MLYNKIVVELLDVNKMFFKCVAYDRKLYKCDNRIKIIS